jgi:membrane glycosyltransferase
MSYIAPNWKQAAKMRRWLMFGSIVLIACLVSYYLFVNLPNSLPILLRLTILLPFSILLMWLELGFFTALIGFWVLNIKQTHPSVNNESPIILPTKQTTAILLPIYNEDTAYVYAGLKSIYQSLELEGFAEHFEFYILSDSDDAKSLLKEGAAWTKLCDELNAKGRIHYRHRKHRVKKKSGNVMDFCRRWGYRHPYMIVLDADSLMSGKTLGQMVSMMEKNPNVGLIQAPLYSTGINSIFGRSQQFVNRLYGPVFFAGLHYWWQGESQYWGHNVIIRTLAFMQHCDLPKLNDTGSLGGEILSHDFVEAALLNRAGWETWVAYELDDSFERPPPTLTDALKRDRRWCQGNLQHWHIIWSRNIPHLQRFLLLGGIMSYVSSIIWFFWLVVLSFTAIFYQQTILIPNNQETQFILVATLTLLFLYKLFGVVQLFKHKQMRAFGGIYNLSKGIIGETLLSILIAPIRMFYYSRFVLEVLTGKRVNWTTQQRAGHELDWKNTFIEYRWVTISGALWTCLLLYFNPMTFLWMSPVLFGLMLSTPVAVITSKTTTSKVFSTPDDESPSEILTAFEQNYAHLQSYDCLSSRDIFTHVLVDPIAHQKYIAYVPYRQQTSSKSREYRENLAERLLQEGPKALTNQEYLTLLGDPVIMCRLHTQIWKLPEDIFARHWSFVNF